MSTKETKEININNIDDDTLSRKEALNTERSFIVQAPAGSGKTTLLTQRVLALLASVVSTPEEALSLTFTRKAAAEMRERVMAALEQASETLNSSEAFNNTNPETALGENRGETHRLACKVLERDKALGWDLLNNPNRLRIQTLDSLCAELSQRMPLHSGLGSSMNISDAPAVLFEEAARNVLESIESNTLQTEPWILAIQILLQHLDNDWDQTLKLLADMLSHRDQWLLSLGHTFFTTPNRAQLEKALQLSILDTLALVRKTLPLNFEEFFVLVQFAAKQLQDSNSMIAHCLNLSTWPEGELADVPRWLGLSELILTDGNELRKTVTEKQGFPSQQSAKNKEDKALFKNMKDSMKNLLEKTKEYPDFCLGLQRLRECPKAHYSETQWTLVQALVTVLPVLVAELLLVFQKHNQIDFIEVALSAHQALGNKDTPTDLSLKLGYKIRHILVDEFQDTSLSQFSLLEKLTTTWSEHEGNTLFLVGDPMQSIYRFRKADVSLFIRAREFGVNDIRLKPLNLTSNFRSHQKVVNWVNDSFSKIFPTQDEMLTGAVRYSPFKAATQSIDDLPIDAEVIIHKITPDTLSEAEQIIQCIETLKCKEISGSMALLVRSRSHLKSIIPALEKRGISYQGVELDKLITRPLTRDLLALTRALMHLGDRIAWLSLLRSPYCFLSLQDIECIATFNETLPLFSTLKQYAQLQGISHDSKDQLSRVVPILEMAMSDRERKPVATWIKQTWITLNHFNEAEPLKREKSFQNEESDTFFEILRETAKNKDIFEIGVLEEQIKRSYVTPIAQDPKALQIMTIHKAKGLEFDTVILAGLGKKDRSDDARLLLWEDRRSLQGENYLLLAPIRSGDSKNDSIYDYLRKQEKRRANYESLRLLYVAATRAKKRLYGFLHSDTLFEEDEE